MKSNSTRDDIAFQIEQLVFSKSLLSLICPPKELIKIITSPFIDELELFYRLLKNVNSKLLSIDAKLEEIYYKSGRTKFVVSKENASEVMHKLLFEDSIKLIFKVKIKNKYFEYTMS